MQTIDNREALTAPWAFHANGETVAAPSPRWARSTMSIWRLSPLSAAQTAWSSISSIQQFGPNEDFDTYPRRAGRFTKLAAAGIGILWMPPVDGNVS